MAGAAFAFWPRWTAAYRPGLSGHSLQIAGVPLWTISCYGRYSACYGGGNGMNSPLGEMNGFQEVLQRKEAELARVLRKRDDIAIEKSADQMDEIQYATERDMPIRDVDRESTLWRDVRE